ncbi:PREDICTED: MATH and LRR domain-containing protein PFE0570w-like [Nicrophorus vespilloides]|uniref:MATH and LRR domain-containing protein PFE0570w-like n=1 Tax=Nicrophorus vespilloides TaxID=110193 RepID=A0ABM1N6D1_NICVS|nr:PREDICTED: MATH and LRR domain-containing protein PFE0570w-like [Nicrophorus vespilloides]
MNLDLPESSELKKNKRNRMLERLTVQNMPIVDIQRELVIQKVLHINIIPEVPPKDYTMASNNICYIECSSGKEVKEDLDRSLLRDEISRNISFIDEARKSSKSVPVKMPSKGEDVVKRIDGIAESIKTDLKLIHQTRYKPELNMVEELFMNINQSPKESKVDQEYDKSDTSVLVYKYSDEPKLNEREDQTLNEEAKKKPLTENENVEAKDKQTRNQKEPNLNEKEEEETLNEEMSLTEKENIEEIDELPYEENEQSLIKDVIVEESQSKETKSGQSIEVSFTEPELREFQQDDDFEIRWRDNNYKDDDDDDDDEPDICICQGAYDPRTNRFPSTIYAVDELVCFCEEKIEAVKEKANESKMNLESIVSCITDEIVESGKVKTTKKEKKSKGKSGCSKIFKHKNVEDYDSDQYVLVHDVSAQVSIDSISQKPVEQQAVKFHDHNFESYGNANFDSLKNKMDKKPIDIIKRKSQYIFSTMGSMDPKQRASMIKRKSIVRRADHGSITSSIYPVHVELDSPDVTKILGPKSFKSSESVILLDELMPKNNPVGDTTSLQKYYKPCKDVKCVNENPGRKLKVQRNIATETLATNTDRKDESISEGEVKLGGNLSNGECPSPKKNTSKASTKGSSRKTERSESSRGRQVVHNKNWVSFYYSKSSPSGVPHINSRSSK